MSRIAWAFATALLLGGTLVWLLARLAAVADAAPPEPGSEQMQLMAPYSQAIGSATNPQTGIPCCNLSDCRFPVSDDVRQRKGADGKEHWFVRITKAVYAVTVNNPERDDFPEGQWLQVDDKSILPVEMRGQFGGNALVCWSEVKWAGDHVSNTPYQASNGFYCFSPPEMM